MPNAWVVGRKTKAYYNRGALAESAPTSFHSVLPSSLHFVLFCQLLLRSLASKAIQAMVCQCTTACRCCCCCCQRGFSPLPSTTIPCTVHVIAVEWGSIFRDGTWIDRPSSPIAMTLWISLENCLACNSTFQPTSLAGLAALKSP